MVEISELKLKNLLLRANKDGVYNIDYKFATKSLVLLLKKAGVKID